MRVARSALVALLGGAFGCTPRATPPAEAASVDPVPVVITTDSPPVAPAADPAPAAAAEPDAAPDGGDSPADETGGHLPPEVIHGVVYRSRARFSLCYKNALKNNPDLEGRVTTRFVISRTGRVASATSSGDLPDQTVLQCVERAFLSLEFPEPEGGIVVATYPFVFTRQP